MVISKKNRSLLKKCDIFSKEEKRKITRFQNQRNRMFHKALFNKPEYQTLQGRELLIKSAGEAFYAANDAYMRKYVTSPQTPQPPAN